MEKVLYIISISLHLSGALLLMLYSVSTKGSNLIKNNNYSDVISCFFKAKSC